MAARRSGSSFLLSNSPLHSPHGKQDDRERNHAQNDGCDPDRFDRESPSWVKWHAPSSWRQSSGGVDLDQAAFSVAGAVPRVAAEAGGEASVYLPASRGRLSGESYSHDMRHLRHRLGLRGPHGSPLGRPTRLPLWRCRCALPNLQSPNRGRSATHARWL
jgi:hypothetical protein